MAEKSAESIKSPEILVKWLSPEEREDGHKTRQDVWKLGIRILNGEPDRKLGTNDPTYSQIIIGGKKFIQEEKTYSGIGAASVDLKGADLYLQRNKLKLAGIDEIWTQSLIFFPRYVLLETRIGDAPEDKEIHEANRKELEDFFKMLKNDVKIKPQKENALPRVPVAVSE